MQHQAQRTDFDEWMTAAPAAATRTVDVAVETDFDFAADEFAALFASSEASAFQHPVWLDAFYRRIAPARGATKIVVTGRDPGTSRLVFVLPMILRPLMGIRVIESADLGVCDYAAPVVAADFEPGPEVQADVLAVLPDFDILRIRPVREEALSAWRMFFAAGPLRLEFCAHASALHADYPAWRAEAYRPSFAKYLDRRKKRFFKAEDARLQRASTPEAIAAAFSQIQRLRAGRFDGDLIQSDFVRNFYAEVAAAGPAFARTYALTKGDDTLGHVFGLTHGGRFHYLLIGCDYEQHGRHSPGLLLYDAIIEEWIAEGGTVFDFTIGDEPFKLDFGTAPTAMFALSAYPTWRGRLAKLGLEAREQFRRLRARRDGAASGGGSVDSQGEQDAGAA